MSNEKKKRRKKKTKESIMIVIHAEMNMKRKQNTNSKQPYEVIKWCINNAKAKKKIGTKQESGKYDQKKSK